MRKLLLTAALCFLPSVVFAQCNGNYGVGQVCGAPGGGPPGPQNITNFSGILGVVPRLMGQLVWSPGTITPQNCNTNSLPVAGVRAGFDSALISIPTSMNASVMARTITVSQDIVTIVLCNPTATSLAAASGNFIVVVP